LGRRPESIRESARAIQRGSNTVRNAQLLGRSSGSFETNPVNEYLAYYEIGVDGLFSNFADTAFAARAMFLLKTDPTLRQVPGAPAPLREVERLRAAFCRKKGNPHRFPFLLEAIRVTPVRHDVCHWT
jgi:hypothetical protein